MSSTNKVTLIGHLGQDPQVRTLPNGQKVAHLRLATHEPCGSLPEERSKNTQWHNLVAWALQASIAEKELSKGRKIMVHGRLQQQSFTDKAGIKRQSTCVKVYRIRPLESNPLAA